MKIFSTLRVHFKVSNIFYFQRDGPELRGNRPVQLGSKVVVKCGRSKTYIGRIIYEGSMKKCNRVFHERSSATSDVDNDCPQSEPDDTDAEKGETHNKESLHAAENHQEVTHSFSYQLYTRCVQFIQQGQLAKFTGIAT